MAGWGDLYENGLTGLNGWDSYVSPQAEVEVAPDESWGDLYDECSENDGDLAVQEALGEDASNHGDLYEDGGQYCESDGGGMWIVQQAKDRPV